jgi:hypothetical protein
MSKPIQDQAALDAHRKREQLPADAEQVVPVRRRGCEDEYDNAMEARFGFLTLRKGVLSCDGLCC